MADTGFIGLGAMGWPMAANLHRAGKLTGIWNRSQEKAVRFLAEFECESYPSPAELACACDAIITCVSADEDLLEIIDRLLPGLRPGSVVIDTSTVAPETARKASGQIAGRGAAFLDAPVSGGVEGARSGSLSMMVGGEESVLANMQNILDSLAARITWMGPVGSGQATKAVNQVMAAGINQAVSEALAFAVAQGLPIDRVIDVTANGAAKNWFLERRGPTMARGQFKPGFRVALHDKDLAICQQIAASLGAALPMVEMTRIHYRRLMESGFSDEDISALYRIKKQLFDPEQKSPTN